MHGPQLRFATDLSPHLFIGYSKIGVPGSVKASVRGRYFVTLWTNAALSCLRESARSPWRGSWAARQICSSGRPS